jgi:uncharacterized tellurite resistance protein B-like protein
MILSGHTRASVFQACRDASDEDKKKDWEEIPAKIYEEDEIKEDTAQQIIIEANMCQRAKESVRLRVRCIGRLAEIGRRQHRYGDANDKVTQRIAERWGIKRSSVFFYQRVAKFLLPVLADRFSDHLMSRTVADYLCRLSTEVQQHMIDSGYIARLTIAYARQFKEGMTKADIKLEELLTVVGPSMIVRILDEETGSPTGQFDEPEDITVYKGTAAKAFREFSGKGRTVKLIHPEVEKEGNNYVLHVYIY